METRDRVQRSDRHECLCEKDFFCWKFRPVVTTKNNEQIVRHE